MGSEWTEATLGEISNLKNGKGLKNSFYREDGQYPVWGANGQIARTDELLNEHPVVVIGRVGAYCGSVHAVFEPNWVTDNAIVATPKENNSFRFLYYFLKYLKPERTSIGSAQPLITQTGLKTLKHSVPPISDQRAIAHILGSLDDKIELNLKMNETLEAMARAIFKSWFVDFDPVRAKARLPSPAGRGIEGEGVYALPKEIADLFPDEFEDSELGEIPKGWEVCPLSDVIDLSGGGTPTTNVKEYWDGDIPWFSVVDAPLESDVFVIDTEKHISQLGVDNSSTKILPYGTTIISARGTVGKCALVGKPMAMNQSCYGITGREERGSIYIYYLIRNLVADLQRSGHGSVFNTITRNTFKTILSTDPEGEITKAFDSFVNPYFQLILKNSHESNTLTKIRDTLLPKLISGELRVPDAEKMLEDVI